MLAIRLIERKRDGGRIEPGEWRALLGAYVAGHVPDYQMAAFLMAVYLRGLDREETAALTESMLRSGGALDLRGISAPRIDKHSTGGVGDKVSLVLAPLAAIGGDRRADDVGARARAHRWHARQARCDPGISQRPHARAGARATAAHRLRAARAERRDRAGGPEAVCAARCDGDGGVDSLDRREHHEQEARGGADGIGAWM